MIFMHHKAIRTALKLFWLLLVCALIPSFAHAGGGIEVKGIRYASYSDYTRVVIDLSGSAGFTSNRIDNPDRLFIDLSGSVLPKELWRTLNLGEGPLKAVRAAQFNPHTVRVVFDLNEMKEYKIFTLDNPPRVVVDVFDKDNAVFVVKTPPPGKASKKTEIEQEKSVAVKREAPTEAVAEVPAEQQKSVAVEQEAQKEVASEARVEQEKIATVEKESPKEVVDEARVEKEKSVAVKQEAPKEVASETRVEQEKIAVVEKESPKEVVEEARVKQEKSEAQPPRYSSKSLAKQKRIPGKKTLAGKGAVSGNLRTVRRVVIDAGHGGHDPGASGRNGIREKDVVLDIAKRIKRILEEKGNYEVYLTRDKDKFLSLEDRTIVANEKNADLFVSVHANAHNSRNIRGLETYFLNFTNDAEALKVAARENRISTRRVQKKRSESEVILASLELQNNRDESLKLANYVQSYTVGEINRSYGHVKDLGVKQALFYVLFGAKMPSVLIEVAFVTNPEEAKRLKSHTYREHLASGIAGGIDEYFDTMPPEQKMAMRY